MAFCKSVDGGSSRHFSLHYIYSSGNPQKKTIPLSLTSRTSHRNFPSPSLPHPRPPYQNIAAAFFPAAYPTHLETTPSLTGAIPAPPNLETIHSSNAFFLEPLQLRSRPPHRSRFADAFVHRTGSSSPTSSFSTPEPLHRRHRA